MKQHISSSQLRELSLNDSKFLHGWWKPLVGDVWLDTSAQSEDNIRHVDHKLTSTKELSALTSLPLMSVGQMIDFLDDIQLHNDGVSWVVISDRRVYMPPDQQGELCDALWEAMKGEINRRLQGEKN
jgi:hypothetical protein